MSKDTSHTLFTKIIAKFLLIITLASCGGGGDNENSKEIPFSPPNIQLGLAIQQYDPIPCSTQCPGNSFTLNYISSKHVYNPSLGLSLSGCDDNKYLEVGDNVCGVHGVSIANPDSDILNRVSETFRLSLISAKAKYVQQRLLVRQFNGVEFNSIHFEVGADLEINGVATIINTRDYVDFDHTIDGTYNIHLCLNIHTGEVHEAKEPPKRLVNRASGGMNDVPLLSCFP